MAWLGQVPKSAGEPEPAPGDPPRKTRAERIEEDGGTATFPELGAPYLLAWLQELGYHEHGAMGAVPLSSAEIDAWCRRTRIDLLPWEFRALRAASQAYVAQLHREDSEPPYGSEEALADPEVIEAKAARILDRLATPVNRTRKG